MTVKTYSFQTLKYTAKISIWAVLFFISFSVYARGRDKKNKEKKNDVESKLDEKTRLREQDAFFDAVRYKTLNDVSKAVDRFNAALEANPENAAAHYEISRLCMAQNKTEEALSHAVSAAKLDGTNTWYQKSYAEILAATGNFEKAADIYDEFIKGEPNNPENYYDKAFMLANGKKYADAIKVLNKLEDITGTQEEISAEKKNLYLHLNDLKSAASEVEKLIKLNPNEPRYYLMLAEMYQSNNQQKETRETYERLQKIDPNNPYALMALAGYYKTDGNTQKYNEAMLSAMRNKSMDLDAKIAYLYRFLQSFNRLNASDKSDVLSLAKELVKTYPEQAKTNALMGDFYYLNNESGSALPYYKKSLSIQQDIITVWQQLFSILLDQKKYQELQDSTQKAMELYPTQVGPAYFNGVANYYLKDYTKAEKKLTKAITMAGDDINLKAQMYALLGDVYNASNQNENSDNAYEESIKLNPNNVYTLNNYAYHLSQRKEKLEKAAEMSKKTIDAMPNSASFLDTYAWILFQQEKYAEAKTYQEKSLTAGEEDRATLLEHYGDILFKLGDVDSAVIQWQKAKTAGSDSKTLDKKIADKKYYAE